MQHVAESLAELEVVIRRLIQSESDQATRSISVNYKLQTYLYLSALYPFGILLYLPRRIINQTADDGPSFARLLNSRVINMISYCVYICSSSYHVNLL